MNRILIQMTVFLTLLPIFSPASIAHNLDQSWPGDLTFIAGGSETARYQITFETTWGPATHPHPNGAANFPSNPHISPLIGALHNDSVSFWKPGELASQAVEKVAEVGDSRDMTQVIIDAIGAGNATLRMETGGAVSPSVVPLDDFTAQRTHPLLTLITMIAPSPDWFMGVGDLSLLDEQGRWRNEIVVDLYPYDAGTEEGSDYSGNNPATSPHVPIFSVRNVSPFSDAPVGRITITRLDPPMSIFLPSILNVGG